MTILSVNVDHVATLRQARLIDYPDPVKAATIAEEAGAEGITFHLREDRRHIQDSDLSRFKEKCTTRLNMEMAAVEEMVNIAINLKPAQVSLVPEKREELTTEGGLKIDENQNLLEKYTKRLQSEGIKVSYFIDPVEKYIKLSKQLGANAIEINTGSYSDAKSQEERELQLEKIKTGCTFAVMEGLELYAGHGLNTENILPLLEIKEIEEYNIGHSLVSDAVYLGFFQSVKRMNDLIKNR
ncbi:MAG: pyridoxine 5'-phosphate synthase [Nitrospinae bacterium]|nr:pyridoxine 5'-phosphate synthase [Nitrospinota bacterium]